MDYNKYYADKLFHTLNNVIDTLSKKQIKCGKDYVFYDAIELLWEYEKHLNQKKD